MFTIVSDRYGFGSYDDLDDIIVQVYDLDWEELHHTHILCPCGELIHGLVDDNDDIVAVETEHLHHMGW